MDLEPFTILEDVSSPIPPRGATPRDALDASYIESPAFSGTLFTPLRATDQTPFQMYNPSLVSPMLSFPQSLNQSSTEQAPRMRCAREC